MTRSAAPKQIANYNPTRLRSLKGRIRYAARKVKRIEKKGVKGPWQTRIGTVRRLAYRLTRELRNDGDLELLKRVVEEAGWTIDSPTIEENPFHWCLTAIDPKLEVFANTAARRRAGAELLYADRHDVPELYLIGFIYQLGNALNIYSRLDRRGLSRMATQIEKGW